MVKQFIAHRNAKIVSRFYNNRVLDKSSYKKAKHIFNLIYATGRKISIPYTIEIYGTFQEWKNKVSFMYNLPIDN